MERESWGAHTPCDWREDGHCAVSKCNAAVVLALRWEQQTEPRVKAQVRVGGCGCRWEWAGHVGTECAASSMICGFSISIAIVSLSLSSREGVDV
jgi:hypothetical protein